MVVAAQVRLNAITASTSQAALAVNTPEGRCASPVLQISVDLLDDRTTTVTVSRLLMVKNAWNRCVSNSVS